MNTKVTKKQNKKRKGFTLVELIVVVAIIAILALIAVPRFVNMTESAKVSTFESNHGVLKSAITMFAADNGGTLPKSIEDLGPYISDISIPATPSGTEVANYFKDKPEGATYTVSADGVLTSKITGLTKDPGRDVGEYKDADKSYEVTYTP